MKVSYLLLISLLIVGALFVPAVSAETILDETFLEYEDTGGTSAIPSGSSITYDGSTKFIRLLHAENQQNFPYIGVSRTKQSGDTFPDEGEYAITYTFDGGSSKPATMYITHSKNSFGTVTAMQGLVFFDEWDVGDSVGLKVIELSKSFWTCKQAASHNVDPNDRAVLATGNSRGVYGDYTLTVASTKLWENRLIVNELPSPSNSYEITLQRVYGDAYHTSQLSLYQSDSVVFTSYDSDDYYGVYRTTDINKVVVSSGSTAYSRLLGESGDTSTNATATIYVRNSQTGALLADAHIEIQDTTTDPWTEVVNQTLTSGQRTISLPKDPGIHLTQYRIGATVPGYQQVVPALFFRVTGPTNVIVEMEPLTGGTEDENNTFLEFYVRDISANAIANANVQVDGQLRWTNAQGYTQFEVPKNASYPYSVTKPGYLTIEGIASVESDDRYVVNVALMSGAVPTQPTVSPTITVEPTPTQTSPIQEDNLIGLSVRGLAKGFGIDYDTALLLFGLMIVFGAGGIVMSSVKGGAMEFIAGSIVGTFVAFALGLIPIWIFIIITVVFGAYVLRVFIQGGQ